MTSTSFPLDEASNIGGLLQIYSEKFANEEKTKKFWVKNLKKYCLHFSEVYIEEKKVAEKFIHQNIYPSSLSTCLEILLQQGELLDFSLLNKYLARVDESIYSVEFSKTLKLDFQSDKFSTEDIDSDDEENDNTFFSSLFSTLTSMVTSSLYSSPLESSSNTSQPSLFTSASGEKVKRYFSVSLYEEAVENLFSYIEKHSLEDSEKIMLVSSINRPTLASSSASTSLSSPVSSEVLEEDDEVRILEEETSEFQEELVTFRDFLMNKVIPSFKSSSTPALSLFLSSTYFYHIFIAYLCRREVCLVQNGVIIFLLQNYRELNAYKEKHALKTQKRSFLSSFLFKDSIERNDENSIFSSQNSNSLQNYYLFSCGKFQIFENLIKINKILIKIRKKIIKTKKNIKTLLKNEKIDKNFETFENIKNKIEKNIFLKNYLIEKKNLVEIYEKNLNLKLNLLNYLNLIEKNFENFENFLIMKNIKKILNLNSKNFFHLLTKNKYSNSNLPKNFKEISLEKVEEAMEEAQEEAEHVEEISRLLGDPQRSGALNLAEEEELEKELKELGEIMKREEAASHKPTQVGSALSSSSTSENTSAFSMKELDDLLANIPDAPEKPLSLSNHIKESEPDALLPSQ